MKLFPLASDRVSLSVTETGGHLSDVIFALPDGRSVRPMHVAPWVDETLATDTPPVLRVLRGDFFCAPFGDSDVLPGERRGHGLPANGTWHLTRSGASSLDAMLDGEVIGASIAKHVEVRPGEAVVYQRHTLSGGSGRIPIGQHAMLNATTKLKLSFGKWLWAGTTPDPFETAPAGRCVLASGHTIRDLAAAKLSAGGRLDLTDYPTVDNSEDLWMLASDPASAFGWTAATSAESGWIWFALKNPRVLPETVVWMSNGGRSYAPWSNRHRRCIGLEEVCAYFHLGHAASISDNPVSRIGLPTAVELKPAAPLIVSYLFGLAEAPAGFGAVADIKPVPGGVMLSNGSDVDVFAACDVDFVTRDKS